MNIRNAFEYSEKDPCATRDIADRNLLDLEPALPTLVCHLFPILRRSEPNHGFLGRCDKGGRLLDEPVRENAQQALANRVMPTHTFPPFLKVRIASDILVIVASCTISSSPAGS